MGTAFLPAVHQVSRVLCLSSLGPERLMGPQTQKRSRHEAQCTYTELSPCFFSQSSWLMGLASGKGGRLLGSLWPDMVVSAFFFFFLNYFEPMLRKDFLFLSMKYPHRGLLETRNGYFSSMTSDSSFFSWHHGSIDRLHTLKIYSLVSFNLHMQPWNKHNQE